MYTKGITMSIDNDVVEYDDEVRKMNRKSREDPKRVIHLIYSLGQEVKNGIRYWGQEKTKGHNRSCMFICPICYSAWRADLHNIVRGSTKSCCWNAKSRK